MNNSLLVDAMHGDCVPALEQVAGTPSELHARLFDGLEELRMLRRRWVKTLLRADLSASRATLERSRLGNSQSPGAA